MAPANVSANQLFRKLRLLVDEPRLGVDRLANRVGRDPQTWSRPLQADDAWESRLHLALGSAMPCGAAADFEHVWHAIAEDLSRAGVAAGRGAYYGWDDADEAFARCVSCLVAHRRRSVIVETGVARGLTSRIVLERLARTRTGHLWSIDLPPLDPGQHREIGLLVTPVLRQRWSYVEGSSRRRLRGVLAASGRVDLFIHDSLHTTRNLAFELAEAWRALRPGGAIVADDIHRNDAFSAFVAARTEARSIVAPHSDGAGFFGIVLKPT